MSGPLELQSDKRQATRVVDLAASTDATAILSERGGPWQTPEAELEARSLLIPTANPRLRHLYKHCFRTERPTTGQQVIVHCAPMDRFTSLNCHPYLSQEQLLHFWGKYVRTLKSPGLVKRQLLKHNQTVLCLPTFG